MRIWSVHPKYLDKKGLWHYGGKRFLPSTFLKAEPKDTETTLNLSDLNNLTIH